MPDERPPEKPLGPLLVCASYLTPQPMDLVINPFELVALALAVMNVGIAENAKKT